MSPRPVVEVRGARELRRTMRRAGADMTELKAVHREAGSIVDHRARGNAPRRTGRLAASERVGATQTASIIRAGYKRTPYAGPIHWGWPARHITAQPWITEAAQATEPLWTARFQQAIERILDKIKGA